MKELVILMATAVPTEKLVDDLKEAISDWECNPTDKNKEMLVFQANLLLINHITNGDVSKATQMIGKIGHIERFESHFKAQN